uniref:Protein transport protein Sec61 subunit gamma n=1 Tax=Volvariella volvacea TaxID=36659 RepID=H6VLD2_9AGAR|nr:protein transport protein Sec61 subunit gamma [Volvariella volvacea]
MSDKVKEFIEIPQQFIREGNQFLARCTKPSQKEFVQICRAVAVGFAVMGFIGYFVKLIHIPINNILVYVSPGSQFFIELTPIPAEAHSRLVYLLEPVFSVSPWACNLRSACLHLIAYAAFAYYEYPLFHPPSGRLSLKTTAKQH